MIDDGGGPDQARGELLERTDPGAPRVHRTHRVRLAVGALVVVALVGAGALAWWARAGGLVRGGAMSATTLLPVPPNPTGPVAAASTGASTEEATGFRAEPWRFARTGADDRQLIVYFDGGGCTYGADVQVQPDVVTVTISPRPPPGSSCAASLSRQALGVELPEPLAGRPVSDGTAVRPVVDGRQLADVVWPPAGARSSSESLQAYADPAAPPTPTLTTLAIPGDPTPFDGRWTWRLEGPRPPPPPGAEDCHDGICTSTFDEKRFRAQQPLRLTQYHWGVAPRATDDATAAYSCSNVPGSTATPVDIGGAPGQVVTCADGVLAVWWQHGEDRVALTAVDPVARGVDADALVALARQVRIDR